VVRWCGKHAQEQQQAAVAIAKEMEKVAYPSGFIV
jgi:hypothetical protein